MPTVVRIQGEAPWVVWYDQASQHFVGRCDPLSLTASGASQADLFAELAEAIQLLFVDLLETGDLDDFLRARHWTRTDPAVDESDPQFFIPTHIDFAQHAPH